MMTNKDGKKDGRKVRALNKSKNDRDKILELHQKEMSPAEIQRHFNNKYSYWQIYNTINPRDTSKSKKSINDNGEMVDDVLREDNNVTEMPDIDLSQFENLELFLEHQLGELLAQINEKRLPLDKRAWLLRQATYINKQIKAQQIEQHLKNPDAKLIIRIMRRLKPDITNDEITIIYKEEAAKLKKSK